MYRSTKYVSGAVASKREYDEYQPNLRLQKQKKIKKSKKHNTIWVVSVFTIALLVGLIIYRYSNIVELNFKMAAAKKNYNVMLDENTKLKLFIEKNLDLDKIQLKAEGILKMQKPSPDQKVAVSVPVKDFSVSTYNSK